MSAPAATRAAAPRTALQAAVEVAPAVAGAVAFRLACYAVMTALALWAERRAAPTVPDAVLSAVPYVGWVARANYRLWLVAYVPLSVALLASEPRRWVRYMVTGGLVSLARGVTIVLTGLGAPDPAHAGPGGAGADFVTAWLQLVSPAAVFGRGAANVYLTKDLFFSGHAATTLLLFLYLRHRPRLRAVALAAHAVAVASVILGHLHYAIDVVGAWAVTFAIYALREGWPRPAGARRADAAPGA